MFEGFWFSHAGIAVPGNVLDESVDAFEDLAVLLLPPQIIFPGIGAEN